MFQLEPTDDDDEAVLNRIAGVCAQNGIDLPENSWVIPPDIMQLHAVYHKILQTESDNNEKTLLSFMVNFTPVIGEIKAITEALAGKDIITGEELTGVEKILGLAAGFADVLYLLNGLKGIKYTDEAVETIRDIKLGRANVIYGTDDIAMYQFNMIENPGPLAEVIDNPAKNFYGGRYNVNILEADTIFFRAGQSGKPLGQWFASEAPESVVKVRINTAEKPQWINQTTGELTGTSIVDTVYVI